eukprot:TRINITY_DN14444_c2_g1_i1.p1 TRINITY_DN14444_c2_g1~~TRINITY_DN14444_c2_g1_i1.p1  ORF type:complete len:429 (-),score=36.40 TRINITY_DN14444_c2_g1_i1:222-1508(-)
MTDRASKTIRSTTPKPVTSSWRARWEVYMSLHLRPRRGIPILLKWSADIIALYNGTPTFLYTHLDAGHVKRTDSHFIDRSVRDHLETMLKAYPDLTIMVMADHGAVNKACDQKAPFMTLILPRLLLDAHPTIESALEQNRRKVTSPFDVFVTLRHLLQLGNWNEVTEEYRDPFKALQNAGVEKVTASFFRYNQYIHTVKLQSDFSPRSLLEVLPDKHGCAAAGIFDYHCSVRTKQAPARLFCMPHAELSEITRTQFSAAVSSSTPLYRSVCKSALEFVAKHLTAALRGYTRGAVETSVSRVCQPFTVERLEFIEGQGRSYVLRVVTGQGDPLAVFDITVGVHVVGQTIGFGVIGARQVTRWNKYQACTPELLMAEFCICDPRKRGLRTEQHRALQATGGMFCLSGFLCLGKEVGCAKALQNAKGRVRR